MARRWAGGTFAAAVLATTALGAGASAQQSTTEPGSPLATPGATTSSTVSGVVVTGSRVRSLEQFTPTGSRLNLSAKDTPATLDVITAQTIETRGYLTAEEAADSLPGVTSGATPGDLSDFHIRGFSDTQITFLHNGLYVGPADMVNRPQNTFNLESVQILKGPASVLYGQGAIGGAVNVVNKAVSFGEPHTNFAASYGSFGTAQVGAGASGSVSDTVAVRLDVSRTSSDGYIHHTPSDSFNTTLSVLWKPTPRLDVQFSLDYLQDDPSPYYGTPLVPTSFATDPLKDVISTNFGYTLDARMKNVNYNVADSYIESHQIWPQIYVKYRLADDIQLDNFFYFFQADRRWKNSETYLFAPATNMIGRDRFFVDHNQTLVGDQGDVTITKPLFGFRNKLNIGYDYSHLDFKRSRGFPNSDEVDPFNPSPGLFGSTDNARVSPTHWDDPAVFFEDIFYVTDQLKVITGSRFDDLSLDRQNFGPTGAFQPGTSFRRTYTPFTYRVGIVYDVNKYITPYLSFTTGQDPVGSNIFLVNAIAGQNFSLGRSRQVEAGVKASAPDNRADMTLAVYDIERHNVLTNNGPDAVVPAGSEYSKGVELSGDVRVTNDFNINANLSYNDATFGKFSLTDAVTGLFVNADGNKLPSAPDWVSNVWLSYTRVGGIPLELGGGVRYVGDSKGDYANTETLHSYATLNLYATYSLTKNVDVTLRVDNLTDRTYAQAVDVNYERQVILGRPRYFQFDVRAHF